MIRAAVLRLFSLLLLGIMLAGCSTNQCLTDGQCFDGPTDFWYSLISITPWFFLFLGVIFLIICIALSNGSGNESGAVAILLVLSLSSCSASGVISNRLEGSERPSIVFQRELSTKQLEVDKKQEEFAYQNRPEVQRDKALNAIKRLEDYRGQKLQPLLKEFETEYQNYYTHLRSALPKLGVLSHEEFMEKRSQYSEQVDLLERSAVLKNSIGWLNIKLRDSDETLRHLNQNAWLLTKQIKLGEVAFSQEDKDAIDRLVAKTDAIVEDKTKPVERQDIANFAQAIFSEIMSSEA